MKPNNTYSPLEYLLFTLWFGSSAIFFYQFVCFLPLHGITTGQARWLFWGLSTVLMILGIAATFRNRRNSWNMVVTIVFPLEIYTVISTVSIRPIGYLILLIVFLLLSAVYVYLIVCNPVKNQAKRKKILCNRLSFAAHGIRVLAAVLLLVMVIPISVKTAFGEPLITAPSTPGVEQPENGSWTAKNHMDTLVLLEQSQWETLSTKEKLQVLNTVKNIEMQYFGITHPVELAVNPLENSTVGQYDHANRVITIEPGHLKNHPSEELLNTLLHECKHAYDHACVDAYSQLEESHQPLRIFNNVRKYKENMENYVSAEDNKTEYYHQDLEKSARAYSEEATEYYFKIITEYLKNPTVAQ